MRILLLHNRYRTNQPSGEDVVVEQDLAALRRRGHDVLLVQRHSDDIADMTLVDKALVPARVVWSRRDADGMRRTLRSFQPDVVHAHNTFPLLSVAPLVHAHRSGVAVVATLHNFRLFCAAGTLLRDGRHCEDCLGRTPVAAVMHRCYRGSLAATAPLAASIGLHGALGTWSTSVDRFIAMSDFSRDLAVRGGLPAQSVVVKPHFVDDPAAVRHGPGSYSLYMGRLSPEKGPEWMLRNWSPELGPLLVIGDGVLRSELESLAFELRLDVHFTGALPRSEARRYLRDARLVVMPSQFYETFGMSAVEAMAAGVPVVAPRMGVLPEIIGDDVAGVSYEFGSGESFRDAARRASEPSESIRLGAAGRERYLALFSEDSVMELLEGIYREAIVACRGNAADDGREVEGNASA
ncbi:glycosyltransferase family 4 protein [Mobilicoccus sp.]|uniref:glycosyltransferase family 4 protein n=1 Tax=Mobilicoccus sp. TaxID=2034349 RepID=UPI0028AF1032|nr:glycosyltransferase family 4 protein [Mobilicoccus sp.]